MPNNIFEQFDEIYSHWSILDKVGKDTQFATMMNRVQGLYQYLVMNYGSKGYLTADEYKYVEEIRRFYQYLQNQKMKVDHDLWNEMMKHLAKMSVKR